MRYQVIVRELSGWYFYGESDLLEKAIDILSLAQDQGFQATISEG